MNKHEEIRKKLERIEADAYRGSKDTISLNCLTVDVHNYITQSKATEKELEGLKEICENGKKEFGLGLPTELQYLQYEEVDGARAVFEYLFKIISKVGNEK